MVLVLFLLLDATYVIAKKGPFFKNDPFLIEITFC